MSAALYCSQFLNIYAHVNNFLRSYIKSRHPAQEYHLPFLRFFCKYEQLIKFGNKLHCFKTEGKTQAYFTDRVFYLISRVYLYPMVVLVARPDILPLSQELTWHRQSPQPSWTQSGSCGSLLIHAEGTEIYKHFSLSVLVCPIVFIFA